MKRRSTIAILILLAVTVGSLNGTVSAAPAAQADNPNPPDQPVKLIFIHHSTGENWLTDGYGDLGRTLDANNYFVSDTNYGWGPNNIGDRTDIPDWVEWFRSPDTPRYMNALLNESGQHANYTRTLRDPGGQNTIVMFKSCFPNSNLDGHPDDPPGDYADYTVSGAKYVYNEILQYFATRPDILFVVITAPPVSDPAFAANARAFNLWLMYDWLAENNYPYNNVVVFDFYNILTGPDHHHRYWEGEIQHTFTPGHDTLYYPSDDDHPSAAGSRKATEEFVPLLNIFYHRWQMGSAQLPPAEPPAGIPGGETGGSAERSGLIADFETVGVVGWVSYRDEATPSRIACNPQNDAAHNGSGALQIDFDIPPGTWSTCELPFESAQNWSASEGIAFYVKSTQDGLPYNLLLFSGTDEEWAAYLVYTETPAGSRDDWVYVEFAWSDFARAEWEANGGAPFATPGHIFAIAFGFDGLEDQNNTGAMWVDDIHLISGDVAASEDAEEESGGLPCLPSLLLPLIAVGLTWLWRKR
jgi:hypothetical protein